MRKKEPTAPQPSHMHLCDRCNRDLSTRNEYLAHRVDIWTTASNLLKDREWGDHAPEASDVLELSIFLAEENQ